MKSKSDKIQNKFISTLSEPYSWPSKNGPVINNPLDMNKFPCIKSIMGKVNEKLGCNMNSVLVSCYSHGAVNARLHQDDEDSLDPSQPICVLSTRATRKVEWLAVDKTSKHKADYTLEPADSSLYVMKAGCQEDFLHRVLTYLGKNMLSRKSKTVINLSESGAFIHDLVKIAIEFYAENPCIVHRVDRIVINIGTNEMKWLNGKQVSVFKKFRNPLCNLVRDLKFLYPNAFIVFTSVLPIRALYNYTAFTVNTFNRSLFEACNELGAFSTIAFLIFWRLIYVIKTAHCSGINGI